MLHESASTSSLLEREEGYAYKILSEINLSSKDILIIASNSGRNAVTIELAQAFQNQGAKVICITNLAHSRSVTSRHSSGLKLYQSERFGFRQSGVKSVMPQLRFQEFPEK